MTDSAADIGFAEMANNLRPSEAGWQADIPASWKQGRTAYGGLSAALLLAATHKNHADLPPLRSANIGFVGPVTDSPTLSTELLRQGRNVTSIATRAAIEDAVVCTANFAFGATRKSTLNVDLPAPDALPPQDCEPFTPPQTADFVPAFFHRFDTRLIAGGRPISGAKDGYIRAWSRHADPASRSGTPSLLCLADVLPPAAMPMFTQMGAVSSMTWLVNILTDTPETEDGWWHVETRQSAGNSGYSSQVMRIWNTKGELVVEGMQSVTLFI